MQGSVPARHPRTDGTMAHKASYIKSLRNKSTEREGIELIQRTDPRFIFPDIQLRRNILDVLGLDHCFRQAFDLVLIPGFDMNTIGHDVPVRPQELTLIELKTTKKHLPDNPRGFFFGATKNEFDLAEKMGDQFRFAFVCLHEESRGYELLTLKELEALIQTKRIQYQINLVK